MEVKALPDAGAGAPEEAQLPPGPGDGVVVRRAVRQGEGSAALVGEHGGGRVHHEAGGGALRHDVQMVGVKDRAAGDLPSLGGVHHRAGSNLQTHLPGQRRHRQSGGTGEDIALLQVGLAGRSIHLPGTHGVQLPLHAGGHLPVPLVQTAVHGGVHRLGKGPLQVAEGDQGVLVRSTGGQSRRQAQNQRQQSRGGGIRFLHRASSSASHRWVIR